MDKQITMRLVLKHLSMLLIALAISKPNVAAEETLTVFWYTDVIDLVPGKKGDARFDPRDRPFYGVVDKDTAKEREDAIDTMNNFRANADPPAGDMGYLTWDETVDAHWQSQRCDSSLQTRLSTFVASKTKITYSEAISIIAKEGKVALAAGKCKLNEFYRPCMFYRNMMQNVSMTFACARSTCEGANKPYRIYCDFRGKDDMMPKVFTGMLYQESTPCQLCPKERGYCYKKLCVSGSEKAEIIRDNPSAVVTCDAPCMNCGERKDVDNVCSCHCTKGFTGLDCSGGSGTVSPTCGACRRKGTPCLNGGRDAGPPTEPCKCLCHTGFFGERCEIPEVLISGGLKVPVAPEGDKAIPDSDLPKIINELKNKVADEVNKFCKRNQENYIKCCGSGTLPTSGPMDFLDSSKVHVLKPVKRDSGGKIIATVYTAVPGNNGLCRKNTAKPTPIVPVPPEVVKTAITDNLANKKLDCCEAKVDEPITNARDGDLESYAKAKVNCIKVKTGLTATIHKV
ncbi:hypothetical protein BOX15_Mlig019681g1 [Macrostomum lignano]|uniref:SCP domain-containing protein n=1 Tax=Macrostomum lignano TaxID=282301 RepID=A0A267FAH5_9PLAT|nr:hypothetical protein BOX15_Mlig019681g1 [Macrostomum lignano]